MGAEKHGVIDALGLHGKTAMIIGAGQGIGEACCLTMAGAGCDIVLVDREADRALGVAERVKELGARTLIVPGDVMSVADLETIVERGAALNGGVDILITVVGLSRFSSILDTGVDRLLDEHHINLGYAYTLAQQFARSRVALGRPGAVTFVTSVGGLLASPMQAAYGAAKAGLIHLAKSMAVEWAPHDIRVNSVAPGAIITPRLPDTEDWDRLIRHSALPMQRRGTVEEVANAILFLSSDLASYVTGQTLAVDGGLTVANSLNLPNSVIENQGRDRPAVRESGN